jgi:hypothetical protein
MTQIGQSRELCDDMKVYLVVAADAVVIAVVLDQHTGMPQSMVYF